MNSQYSHHSDYHSDRHHRQQRSHSVLPHVPYIPPWKSQNEPECDRLDPDTPPEQQQLGSNQMYAEEAPYDNQRPEFRGRTAGMVADRQGHARQTTRPGRDDITQ